MKRKQIALLSVVIAAVAAMFNFVGCGKAEGDKNVSQIRYDILSAETDNYVITAYAESREVPLKADGISGERSNEIIVKICSLSALSGTYSISLTIDDKEYTATPEQRADNILKADVPVESLPGGSFVMKITGEKSAEAELKSVLPGGFAEYTVPLETVKKEIKTVEKEKDSYEYFVRVICENGEAFWYVGYITEDKTYSYLLDASGTEIIARKTDDNRS